MLRRLLLILYVVAGCQENQCPNDDLGPFYQTPEVFDVSIDYPNIDGISFDIDGPYIIYAGLTRLISPTNPDLGDPLDNVTITIFDMSQQNRGSVVSDKDGAFIIPISMKGGPFDGYIELAKQNLPTVRQFDREFSENWTNMRLRMLDKSLYDIPRSILEQKEDKGYIQGSVYEKASEKPLSGLNIVASGGEVAYLSDGIPVPSKDLKSTQSQGVFFVANCPVGPITIKVYKGQNILAERMVLTWQGGILTQVGIPIDHTSVK